MVSPNTLIIPFAPETGLVRSVQDSILLMNPTTGVLVFVSRKAERLVQRSKGAENRGPSDGGPICTRSLDRASPTGKEPTRNLDFDYSST